MINSFRIAYRLLKNNMKIYGFYLTVLVVTVATYYNFAAISYNETFIELADRLQSAVVASIACGFVLICTVVFFMWHANGFFIKQRQKEIGLYMLMGISSSNIGRVFAIESMLLGGMSLIIGLPVGMLFSKLFFMLLGKAMFLNTEFPLNLSLNAVIQLILIFTAIFVILGFKNYRVVKKSQLINMLNAAKKKGTVPRLNYAKGGLGILLIVTGYIIGTHVRQWGMDLLIASVSTLVAVCLGTYLFFGSFLTIVFSKLVKCRQVVYKNVRIISVNNIFFRLNLTYRTLAMTAVLAASTLTAFNVSLSFRQFADNNAFMESPYSFSYIGADEKVKDRVIEIVQESGHQLVGVNDVKICVVATEYLYMDRIIDYGNQALITGYSQVEKTLEFLNYKGRDGILKKIKPREDEATFVLNANTIATPIFMKGEAIRINGEEYTVKDDLKIPFTGNIPILGKKNIYVLLDSEYQKLKAGLPEITLNGVQILAQNNNSELVQKIEEAVPGGFEVYPRVTQYVWEYYALGILFFLGLIISMVFILATFSTLYFKILSHALIDREQYTILKKIGMSKKEVAKSVYMQVGIEFLLPIIIGIIHSVVAMNTAEELMNADFMLQTLIGIGLFVSIILVFYKILSKNYIKMVYGREV